VLKIVHLVAGYGALRVIDGVSIHVNAGEVVALVGANGAGKSTLLKTVAGLMPPREGRILLRGKEMAGQPASRIAAAGLTLVPEGRGLFPGMTVRDNLRMGGYAGRMSGSRLDRRIQEVCAGFPDLLNKLGAKAGSLSGGQQQMLALARALVGQPGVLLLDEPSTGLAPLLVAEVFKKIKELKSTGVTLILAEQNVRQALRVSDRAYVMRTGRVVMEGTAEAVAASDEVKTAYLGM
jgi:branched-chain amino acid transport system ATP-binding protein